MTIMTTKKEREAAAVKSQEILKRSYLKEGQAVYSLLLNVSSNGMSRRFKVLVVEQQSLFDITWHVARAVGWRYNERYGAVVVSGAGMDMGFHLVYTLAQTLYRNGYSLTHRAV